VTSDALRLDRRRFLAEIDADPDFDVLIVGGGVASAATLRELSVQGLRCLLVERADFASGASGALTRVAQGGFRYLEKGEIRLVRRSATERNLFVAAAPHQTRPLRVVLPSETWLGGAATALLRALGLADGHSLPGALVLRAAVALYDALGRGARVLPLGGLFTHAELGRRYPGISPRFRGAAYEYEALIASPERVAIELIEDAVAEGAGSVALNYAEIQPTAGALVVSDRLSGAAVRVNAGVVVNAAGANVDRVAKLFGVETRLVDGVAGTHLLLRAPDVAAALGDDLLFFEDDSSDPRQRRLCCVYTIGGVILLGATEIPVADPDASRPTAAEDAYLLAALRRLFPAARFAAQDIVGRLHGVRPLAAAAAAADDLTGRSREHFVHVHAAAEGRTLVSIAGGKWTTFHAVAADAADAALTALGRARRASTERRPIGGGRDFPRDAAARQRAADNLAERFGVDGVLAERLIATYGSRAIRVAAHLATPGARTPIAGGALTVGEVRFFAREELAIRAEDVARRRSRLFVEGAATREALDAIDRALDELRRAPQTARSAAETPPEDVEHAAV
jgi:glycerol-3-phosphate dehydrogenase